MTKQPHSTLDEPSFQRLAGNLDAILKSAAEASSQEKLTGYWHIGQLLQAESIDVIPGYRTAVLRELAESLDVSARTLHYAIDFHQAYRKVPSGDISWAHYKILSSLGSATERTFYAKQITADGWSVRQLQSAVHADLFAGGSLQVPTLTRPTAPGYVYLAELERIIDADTLVANIDLGFHTWARRTIRLAAINAPEAGSAAGRKARNFATQKLRRARTMVLRSQRSDLHGRFVGHVFLSPLSTTLDDCYLSGTHFNAQLVQSGHAVVV